MLFDTHVHLIYRDRLSYPWLQSEPALNRDAHYDEYQRTARRIGISGAFHMEVDVADHDRAAETDLVAELMKQPDCLLQGAIAACRPEEACFAAELDRLVERPEVRGLRRVLHVMPDALSQTRHFRDHLRRLSATPLTFDLCLLPRQLPLGMELADHCPDVQFVLDHCGVPDVAAGTMTPWAAHISALARRPNVTAKISGVIAYTDRTAWTLEQLRPFVEHTIEAFGWERVVWGSDSPVCTLGGSLDTWVAATHALLSGCSSAERGALMHANAARLWRLQGQG